MEDARHIVRVGFRFGVLAVAGLGLVLGGCSGSGGKFKPSGNPLLDVRNPELLERDRVAAARAAWDEVESGVRMRDRTREAFKSLAWSNGTGEDVRRELVRLLMSDRSPEGEADSRRMARLMLPTERSPEIVRVISDTAVERGWTDALPSLVRSYARVSPNVPDAERSERAAIEALAGGRSVEDAVYGVFLRPAESGTGVEGAVLRTTERTRDDAWTLLSRLDSSGRSRARLIGEAVPADADAGSAADVETLRAGLRELGVLPRTGEELAWLRRLHRHEDEAVRATNAAWWAEVRAVVGGLGEEQRRGLELRHAEALRWSAAHAPSLLQADRAGLLAVMTERLDKRSRQTREAPRGRQARSEKLRDWADRMAWGDALTLVVVDDAVRSGGVLGLLFEQVELDRKDTTTEYGGVLEATEGDAHRVVLFRPRARDRLNDEMFVASTDMIRFSDRALGHYHLQVQDKRMSREAGPSDGDLVYASASGRTCLVFTSIGSDTLNADFYTPDGEIVDLGLLVQP
jgi:hypothetical protein